MATGDEITLKDAFNSSGYRIETLMFADGSEMTVNEVYAEVETLEAFVMNLSSKSSLLAQAMSSFESTDKVVSYSKADSNFVSNNITIPIVER
ncbi:hypothetical protein VCHA43O270_30605 [Vibrio chagasii]|nr:hypothetical protein VCHA43O270_30605 [Vibrio chagasii]